MTKTENFVLVDVKNNLSAPTSLTDSGEAVLTGAVNAHIRFTALSSRPVKLRLDLDGNGIFERTAFLPWVDLAGLAGSDLRDTDGDGMHDSWETANGLNPNSNDATLDPDGDGASNLAEYQAGSDPKSAASIP